MRSRSSHELLFSSTVLLLLGPRRSNRSHYVIHVRSSLLLIRNLFRFMFTHQLTLDKCKSLLVQAVCNILMKCKHDKYRIVDLSNRFTEMKAQTNVPNSVGMADPEETAATEGGVDAAAPSHGQAELEWSPDEFHERLSVRCFDNIDDVEKYFAESFSYLSGNYGVLLFMYTVLLTKVAFLRVFCDFSTLEHCFHPQKMENIIAELLDTSEPLIHNTYGYGSQGLINVMLTGQAVPHVWDHDKDVGGLSESNHVSLPFRVRLISSALQSSEACRSSRTSASSR